METGIGIGLLVATAATAGYTFGRRARRERDGAPELLLCPSAYPVSFHKAPRIDADELAGMSVAVAYNLHECPRSSPRAIGETCYTLRERPRSKVLHVVERVVLRDARYWVSASSLRAIRNTKQRQVCCYINGVIESSRSRELADAVDRLTWHQVRFNPHRDDGFADEKGRVLRESAWCIMADRMTIAAGVKYGRPHGPR